jgi:glycosyltransferase involved in cell wall biosynthesis
MQNLILATGIDSAKVFLIPIGINPDFFSPQTPASRQVSREKYGIPQSAVVVGSFQKDGDGWGEGLTPKLIKGPDVFLQSADILKKSVPELFVLLSGPARGYVKKGLEELRIPYKHVYLEHYPQINELYHCLDLYIVASREEGGPKAILESMASGVPLVTTRVGQAMDMVVHGANGFMVDVEDAEGLAFSAQRILSDSDLRQSTVANGLRTMRRHTYTAQMPLWQKFFAGFVEHGPS